MYTNICLCRRARGWEPLALTWDGDHLLECICRLRWFIVGRRGRPDHRSCGSTLLLLFTTFSREACLRAPACAAADLGTLRPRRCRRIDFIVVRVRVVIFLAHLLLIRHVAARREIMFITPKLKRALLLSVALVQSRDCVGRARGCRGIKMRLRVHVLLVNGGLMFMLMLLSGGPACRGLR